ncbi:MAG: DUF4159 domain-containing protein [Phycisphaerae bacterium]|nr:DUF4159 domain-containing protein [Phycisphaerae bacterium]
MPKSAVILSIVLVSALLSVSSDVFSAPKKKNPGVGFSDAAVKEAIDNGAGFLWSQQEDNGGWKGHGGERYPTGPGAMAIYALLESGVSPQEPKMMKALKWLEETPEKMVYCLGMRANAWEVANRTTKDKYKEILKSDIARVINSTADGSFHYETGGSPKRGGDNSTSQFGLLAMWAGSLNDVSIRTSAWKMCMDHWMRTQSPEGGWNYRGTGNKPTMTAAGIASMYVCVDNLYAQTFVRKPARAKDFPALMSIQKGVNRLDKTFKSWGGGHGNYYMYGIERVGLACGYKYFNGKDWYKDGATHLLRTQKGDGAWGEVYSTAFSMLFLIRGQHPVLFNKLMYNGDWNNRPRDLASLTRWMSKMYERTLNWQIVDLKMPIRDWHDAPILVITGSKAPAFDDANISKLRNFVLQGGTILSIAESTFSSKPFSDEMRKVYAQMFPDYQLKMLPKGHELYTRDVYYNLPYETLKFEVINNGVRPLVIHTDKDMVARWQGGATGRDALAHFKAATNIARYVAGQLENLRHRGVSYWPGDRGGATSRTIRISRLKHSGNWNPEPMADKALALKMKNRAKVKLEIGDPIGITDLPAAGVKLALMTGTDAVTFSASEKKAFKAFLEGGGTVLIDVAGGNGRYGGTKPFARSILGALKATDMFPGRRNKPRQLAYSSPLYNIEGNTIKAISFRQHTKLMVTEKKYPQISAIMVGDRPAILFSEMDLTAGMVGYPSLLVDGYTPDSAFKLVRNIILYANK